MNHAPTNQAAQSPHPYLVLYRAGQIKIRPPELYKLFSALGNNHRRKLFEILCHHEAQIEDLARLTNAPYQAIRKQLAALEEAGLITSYKDKNYRFFHAAPNALTMLQIWAETMSRILEKLS